MFSATVPAAADQTENQTSISIFDFLLPGIDIGNWKKKTGKQSIQRFQYTQSC